MRGRRWRAGRGGAGVPAGPCRCCGDAAGVAAGLRPAVPRRHAGPAGAGAARRARAGASRCSRRSRTARPTRSCGAPRPASYRLADYRRTSAEVPVLRAGAAGPVPAVHGRAGRAVPRLPVEMGARVSALLRDRRRGRPRDRRRVHPGRGAAPVAGGPGRRRGRAQLEGAHPLHDHRDRAGRAPGHLLVRGAAPGRRPAAVRARADRRTRRHAGGARPGRELAARLHHPGGHLPGAARRRHRPGGRRAAPAGCRGSATGSTGSPRSTSSPCCPCGSPARTGGASPACS